MIRRIARLPHSPHVQPDSQGHPYLLFIRGNQNLLGGNLCKGAEMNSWAKSGKETVAGAHRRPKKVLYYSTQAPLGHAQDAQVCSPSAQIKAAIAHARRIK